MGSLVENRLFVESLALVLYEKVVSLHDALLLVGVYLLVQ